MRLLPALWQDRSGAVTILTALSMTASLGCLAFAVDMGSIYFQARRLQGIADAAALAAVADLTRAETSARGAITANNWTQSHDLRVNTGSYVADSTKAAALRFTAGTTTPNAARVTIASDTPLFFGIASLGRRTTRITRTATAARLDMASFTIGSRLASLDGGIANSLLSGLTGSTVNLSVMDYNALLNANVDLLAFTSALRTQLNVQAGSFNDVISANMKTGDALRAVAAALDSTGSGTAAAAVRKLLVAAPGNTSLQLGKLINLGPIGSQDRANRGQQVSVNVFDMIRSMLELSNGSRQVALDLGATVPGLLGVKTKLSIGDRAQTSPWVTITDKNAPVVRTSQTRLYLDANVGAGANLLGIASVRLPVYVELAEAEAKLNSIACSQRGASRSVVLDVKPSVGQASIADIEPADISNHSAVVTKNPAKIVGLPLISVTGQSTTNLTSPGWQSVSFSNADISAGTTKTVSSTTLVQGLTTSLVSKMNLTVNLLGLGLNASAVTALVGNTLTPAAPLLDGVLNSLTGLLGIHLGQADVRVNGTRCGMPSLVA